MSDHHHKEDEKQQKNGNGCLLWALLIVVAFLALLGSASPFAVLGDMSQSVTFAPSASLNVTNIDTMNNTTNNTTIIQPPPPTAVVVHVRPLSLPDECVWSGGTLPGEERYIRINGQNYFVNRAGERIEIAPPLVELPCR